MRVPIASAQDTALSTDTSTMGLKNQEWATKSRPSSRVANVAGRTLIRLRNRQLRRNTDAAAASRTAYRPTDPAVASAAMPGLNIENNQERAKA